MPERLDQLQAEGPARCQGPGRRLTIPATRSRRRAGCHNRLQPVQGRQLSGADQLVAGPFGEAGVVLGMASPGALQLAGLAPGAPARNSRIISSMPNRGSPSGPSVTVTRLTSISPAASRGRRRAGSPPARRPRRTRPGPSRPRTPRRAAAPPPVGDQQVMAPGDGGPQASAAATAARHRRRPGPGCDQAGRGGPGGSSLTREAASSIASGRPSSRRQIAAMSAALSAVTAKPARTMSACCTNSRAAPHAATCSTVASRGRSSGGTGSSYSPCRWSGRREVASTTRRGRGR